MNYYYHPNMPGGNGEPPRDQGDAEGFNKTVDMKEGTMPVQGATPVPGQYAQPQGYTPVPGGAPVPPGGYAPAPGQYAQPQGYAPAPGGRPINSQGGYAPVPQGYAVPAAGQQPPPQGYAPVPQGRPVPPQGYAPAPQGRPMPPLGYQQPTYQQPVVQQPVYQQPTYQQPIYQQPMVQPVVPVPMQPVLSPEEQARMEAEKAEYKTIRRHGNGLGVGMLLVQAIGTVVALLVPFIAELLIPGVTENGGVYYDALEYAIYSPVAILLAMWIGLKIIRKPFGELVPFGRMKPLTWLACILFSFAFIFVGNIAGDIAAALSPQTVDNINSAMGNEPSNLMELAVNILQVAAIPALVEELAFRGIALGVLRPYGDKFAIIVSSLLFGLLHGNIVQIPFAFCVGLIMAYTVVRTNNILPAMIIHFINNGMSCVLSYYVTQNNLSQEQQGYVMLGMYGVWIVIGVGGFFLLRFGCRQKLRECYQPYSGCLTTGKRNKALIGSAPLIASMIIYGLSVLVMLMNVSDVLSEMPF